MRPFWVVRLRLLFDRTHKNLLVSGALLFAALATFAGRVAGLPELSNLRHSFTQFPCNSWCMEHEIHTPFQDSPRFFLRWGFWAVLSGAVALGLVFAQIVGPTYEPKPSAASQIGEIAGEIKRSAWRSFLGLPKPQPQAAPVSVWSHAAIAAPVLGVIAVVLSLVSGVLRENWRYAVYGTSLGAAAIVFQYFWWIALLVAGVVLLVAIIENIGDIFSF